MKSLAHRIQVSEAHHPVPAAGIPFGLLVRVEWEKATNTRAGRWLLVAVAASTVGVMLAPMVAPSSIDQSHTSYLSFAGLALSVLLPVVAILMMTSEWSQRTALTTFTQEPRRMRVMSAKIVVSLQLGALAAVFGGVATAIALGLMAASGRILEADLTAGAAVSFLLYVLVNVLTGSALGALLHSSAAAIVVSFAVPMTLGTLSFSSKAIANWFDPSTAFNWILEGEWGGNTPQILVALLLWVASPLAAGAVRTVRRDV
jgi:ABC-2 type transport system permease protein